MIFAIALSVFAALQIHNLLLKRANITELKNLAEQIVGGAEKSIDYAILSMFELDEVAEDLCSAAGQLHLARAVHLRSVVKDVRVLDESGQTLCSAFPDSLLNNAKLLPYASGQSARNSAYSLFNVDFANRKILGVSRHETGASTLLVLIDVEAQLFAALPSAIRDHTYGSLITNDSEIVSSVGSKTVHDMPIVSAQAASLRFPITFDIALDEQAFERWNRRFENQALWFGFIFGALLSAVLIRELRRPMSDKEQILGALSRHEIQPYFQPIKCAHTDTIISCEVLARWIKSDGTIISPAQFIPMAEATSTVVPMTRQLMQKTFQDLKNILRNNSAFSVAFNITPSDFASTGFVSEILALAKKSDVEPNQITLEITEREGFANMEAMAKAVQQARKAGFCVSLDDTGTGHNGLSHVQDISADVIKIDKKFVDLVGQAPSADAIIDMLVGLARRLSMKTVAEGIETQDQMIALRSAGVDCFQGYLISKPLTAAQFISFYENNFRPQTLNLRDTSQSLSNPRFDLLST